MGRTAEAAANIDRYRHPSFSGRLDLGGRRRMSVHWSLWWCMRCGPVHCAGCHIGREASSELKPLLKAANNHLKRLDDTEWFQNDLKYYGDK